jgi:hypothetical protein
MAGEPAPTARVGYYAAVANRVCWQRPGGREVARAFQGGIASTRASASLRRLLIGSFCLGGMRCEGADVECLRLELQAQTCMQEDPASIERASSETKTGVTGLALRSFRIKPKGGEEGGGGGGGGGSTTICRYRC